MKSCCVFLGFIAGGWCRSLQGEGVHPGCHSVCDWSEVDADDQGEEAGCVWSTVTELDLSLVCRAARMWQMIPNITCLLTGANCWPGFTFLIENLSCRHLCSSWADKTSQGVSLFGLLEKNEDVQQHSWSGCFEAFIWTKSRFWLIEQLHKCCFLIIS